MPSSATPPKQDVASPIFIGGQYGSGTWLVTQLIEANTDVAFLGEESHFYRYFHTRRAEFHDDQGFVPERLLEEILSYKKFPDLGVSQDDVTNAVRDLQPCTMSNFFAAIWRLSLRPEAGKTRWGDKSPLSELCWPDVYRDFPTARFVWVLRDPRAVCLSNRRRFNARVLSTASGWCDSIDAWKKVQSSIPANQLHCVKYEDLAEKPKATKQQLLDFIGGECNPGTSNASIPKAIPRGSFNDSASEITNVAIDKWRTQLNSNDIALIQLVCSKYMQEFGYQPIGVPAWARIWARRVTVRSTLSRSILGRLARRFA